MNIGRRTVVADSAPTMCKPTLGQAYVIAQVASYSAEDFP
jgi:hypothetical protein